MQTPLTDKMPAKLKRLPEIAYNLWWSWTPEARELFRRLDYPLWRETQHNPVHMLQEMSQQKLAQMAADGAFHRRYNKVLMLFDQYQDTSNTWYAQNHSAQGEQLIAYFSAEFGLHNSLPIYSGGLGILSGDHVKEASDIGLPLVAVGFMYPQGYFRQRIPSHGWQEAHYQQLEIARAPIQPATHPDGSDVRIAVRIGDRTVHARIWHVRVGRVSIYMMDTDVDDNDPWDRELSARLYSGDNEMRIRQEMMLGIGGVRTLRALGLSPTVWHMNEGHSAFLTIECVRERVAAGASFHEALAAVRQATVFTTHTPVPAGHDVFPFYLVEKYFWPYWDELGISREAFLALGEHREPWGMAFNMTTLALRIAGQANGVSKLHGQVSRDMWYNVWAGATPETAPISHVTNGVHVPTWLAPEFQVLWPKKLGLNWTEFQDDPQLWERLAEVSDELLWEIHVSIKQKLLSYMRERARRRWLRGQADATQMLTAGTVLDPDALTIGFARRFATYKRATLIFRDLDRLRRLLHDRHRPVQIIFAGKAHPADDPGKSLIQQIYNFAKAPEMGGRIAFIEDYDMHAARYLKQGVDVWLNNPRRPREASGTSGMKAGMNGVPNLSISDGWWVEGYNGGNGWVIGSDHEYGSEEEQDAVDANSIYELLEHEIIPLYYDRDRDGIPRGWIEVMRESIRSVSPQFSMRRMLKDYTEQLYIKAMQIPTETA